VRQQEAIADVLPADEPVEVVARSVRRRRQRTRRYYPQPVYLGEEPEPGFFTFDRVLGLVLFGAGVLLLVILTLAGSALAAGLISSLFLIPGVCRFLLPDFLTGTRFAGLISLLFGVSLVVLINASNRNVWDTELGMVPFMFVYIGAVIFSILGMIGLLKG
jgi:hypothetical protein